MKYVLDTNTLAALMRGSPAAIGRLKASSKNDVGLPQPVVAEISYGIARLPRSKRKAGLERTWKLFADQLPRLAWRDEVSREFGDLKAWLQRRGRPIEDFDLAIAAHALAYDAVLVSSDAAHMARVPRLRLDDWTRD